MINPSPSEIADVLVIGAGISGLHAARELRAFGRKVLVLEKSRGVGGRAATRRWEGMPVDHGAQFFTARSNEFKSQAEDWLKRGICHEWTRGFHQYSEGSLQPPASEAFPRYVCRSGMSSLGRDLAGEERDYIQLQMKVASISNDEELWKATTEDGKQFLSKSLVVTAPPGQSSALIADAAPEVAAQLNELAVSPCLAVVARYPRRDIGWHGVQCGGHPVLSWIGNDTSKRPELHPQSTILVMHATPEFSREHYQSAESDLVIALLYAAAKITGEDLASPQAFFLQRWRYALPDDDVSKKSYAWRFDVPAPLVIAGDCIAGCKIEGAWLSGLAAAQHLKSCAG